MARGAARRLKIRPCGAIVITFIDSRAMRRVNRRFLRHRGLTDVVCFRYEREPVAGEILIAPAFARAYAKTHGLSYRQELARDVIHGLLHWKGDDDKTPSQQRRMHLMEEELLGGAGGRRQGARGRHRAPRPTPRAPF